ncbi:hypothetical protein AJ79_03142 [Helicocarpus griseus UAMH5409]|uniref:Uncharacterized protein n=1 Tax=Helicocarpus griseus UAMH5409 TaxID=1447875 RepID=A0A2B7XZ70_9EURO|nr:hypothetical protein AJ79_03142 [Helicocarpus griseus UAMH5409]
MEPLYASSCRGQPDPAYCMPLVKCAIFGPTQILGLTIICALLNHFVFNSAHLGSIYGHKYTVLTHEEQRRLSVLHVGIVMKVLAFILLAVPAYRIGFESATWLDPGWLPGLELFDMASRNNGQSTLYIIWAPWHGVTESS